MKFVPFHDWAVIRPAAADEVTSGGLYIPDSAKEKPHEGVVEAIGPGAYEEPKGRDRKKSQSERKFIPTTVKPGDTVLYERYAGGNYKIEGEEKVLVRERDILGLLFGREAKKTPAVLQIPAVTSTTQPTALVKRPSGALVKKKAASVPAVKKATQKKTVKKAVKKKNAAKKKAAGKKAAKKTSLKKTKSTKLGKKKK